VPRPGSLAFSYTTICDAIRSHSLFCLHISYVRFSVLSRRLPHDLDTPILVKSGLIERRVGAAEIRN
jgi:hypothetical protein